MIVLGYHPAFFPFAWPFFSAPPFFGIIIQYTHTTVCYPGYKFTRMETMKVGNRQ